MSGRRRPEPARPPLAPGSGLQAPGLVRSLAQTALEPKTLPGAWSPESSYLPIACSSSCGVTVAGPNFPTTTPAA